MPSISDLLTRIGQETATRTLEDGVTRQAVTKDELLARALWDEALGYIEHIVDASGGTTPIQHPPNAKIMQLIIERREGKNINITEDESAKLLDKVSDLAASRANSMAEDIVGEG